MGHAGLVGPRMPPPASNAMPLFLSRATADELDRLTTSIERSPVPVQLLRWVWYLPQVVWAACFARRARVVPAPTCQACGHPWREHGFEPGCMSRRGRLDGGVCGCMLRPSMSDALDPGGTGGGAPRRA